MNKRRTVLVSLGMSALLAPLGALAQQTKIHRIGHLLFISRKGFLDTGRRGALTQGMADLGYLEGRNFVLEERFSDGKADLLDGLAAELVRLNVDLILTTGTPAHLAAQRATRTIPIVAIADADPVGNGLAASLARPGGNITGMSTSAAELAPKLVELLTTALPKLTRFAVLSNSGNRAHPPVLPRIEVAAQKNGRHVVQISAGSLEDIERGFATMARERLEAVLILIDGFFFQQRKQIAELALKHRMASIYPAAGYAEAGGLMSYGSDLTDNYRRAGIFVDKILRGAHPSNLPFEQPTRYYLEINHRTAAALGIRMPQELLLRADKVL